MYRLPRWLLAQNHLGPGTCNSATYPEVLCSESVTSPSSLLRPHVPVRGPLTGCAFGSFGESSQLRPHRCWSTGPSRRYLCESFPRCLDLYPGGFCGAPTRFFPQNFGLPSVRIRSAPGMCPCSDFYTGSITGLQSFLNVQASKFACHPDRSYRYDLRRMAAVAFTSKHRRGRYLPPRWIC
jgi:hypothetical protein